MSAVLRLLESPSSLLGGTLPTLVGNEQRE